VSNWKQRGVPAGLVLALLLERRTQELPEAPPVPEHLRKEWQATHSFTAMVEALRHLERIPPTDVRAWQTRLAWEAVLSAAEIVLKSAGWTEAEWRRVFEERLDHWLRPKRGRRSEQELLTERLQIELGFRWEEDS